MEHFVAVSIMGENQSALLETLARAIRDSGCGIVDSRMSVLGDRFAATMFLSGTWDSIAKVEDVLDRLSKKLGIVVDAQRSLPRQPQQDAMPYAIEVVAVDRPGIVHDIAEFFAHRAIEIQDMYSGNYQAAHTGTKMCSLHMTIGVPTSVSIAGLRNEFMEFCDQLNLDAIMEPVK
ncbi:MAG: ACT domain-containing protein [Pseudomonadota bacterium]